MVLVKTNADSEAGNLPSRELIAAMGEYNRMLAEAGVLLDREGLKPSAAGKRVRFDGESRAVSGGPFGPASELVAGYRIWQVEHLDQAIELVQRCPNLMPRASTVEIRPLLEPSGFDDPMAPEIVVDEDRLCRRIEGG